MENRRILKITGLSIVAVLIVAFALVGFVFFDGMSYTATDSQKLNPAGASAGKALVVYDPGISRQAKNAAEVIAKDLQEKEYTVDLAGINSATAKNTSGYDIIVVGGPIYAAKAGASVQSYLSVLKPDNGTKIAVYATGQDADVLKNETLLLKEVAPLPEGSLLQIIAITKFIENEDINKKSAEFVNSILK